jgi:hypothetical protein
MLTRKQTLLPKTARAERACRERKTRVITRHVNYALTLARHGACSYTPAHANSARRRAARAPALRPTRVAPRCLNAGQARAVAVASARAGPPPASASETRGSWSATPATAAPPSATTPAPLATSAPAYRLHNSAMIATTPFGRAACDATRRSGLRCTRQEAGCRSAARTGGDAVASSLSARRHTDDARSGRVRRVAPAADGAPQPPRRTPAASPLVRGSAQQRGCAAPVSDASR